MIKRIGLLIVVSLFVVNCGSLRSSRVKTIRSDGLTGSGKILKGTASWYGKRFHGRKTANGERYNMYGMTVAHKKLPFGTLLEVTNLENNKKIIVRVNDRGPYVGRRILDLSYAAAKELDFIHSGTTKILAQIMVEAPEEVADLVEEEPADSLTALLEKELESE